MKPFVYTTGEEPMPDDIVIGPRTNGPALVTTLEEWSGRVFFLRRGARDSDTGMISELALVCRDGVRWDSVN